LVVGDQLERPSVFSRDLLDDVEPESTSIALPAIAPQRIENLLPLRGRRSSIFNGQDGEPDILRKGHLNRRVGLAVLDGVDMVDDSLSLREQVDALERSIIARTLAATSGNQSEAARRLGLSRSSFIDRLKKYGFAGGGLDPTW